MVFDKSRHSAELYGDVDNGARYFQDGVYYNNRGEEVARDPGYTAPSPKVHVKGSTSRTSTAKIVGRPAPQREVEAENRKALDAEDTDE